MQIIDKRKAMAIPAILRLGFRPFFLLGAFLAALAMPVWVAVLQGWWSLTTPLWGWLALSMLGHFLAVVFLMRSGRMTPGRSRLIHLSVLVQMLGILFLAKAMFLLNW